MPRNEALLLLRKTIQPYQILSKLAKLNGKISEGKLGSVFHLRSGVRPQLPPPQLTYHKVCGVPLHLPEPFFYLPFPLIKVIIRLTSSSRTEDRKKFPVTALPSPRLARTLLFVALTLHSSPPLQSSPSTFPIFLLVDLKVLHRATVPLTNSLTFWRLFPFRFTT